MLVPSNIAEGQARFSRKEFHHFLSLARGSLVEIETQLIIVENLVYLSQKQCQLLLSRSRRVGTNPEQPHRINQESSLGLQ